MNGNITARDKARDLWSDTGLSVRDLDWSSIRRLRKAISDELVRHGLMGNTLKLCPRTFSRSVQGNFRSVEIRCRSYYFDDRQAITFEENGFVGFAGWADDVHVQPFLDAFCAWASSEAQHVRRYAA